MQIVDSGSLLDAELKRGGILKRSGAIAAVILTFAGIIGTAGTASAATPSGTWIAGAVWTTSRFGRTLRVTPTQRARQNAGSYEAGAQGWKELYALYKSRGLTKNLGSMQNQYICHQQFVAVKDPKKPTWNLDEWRPDVGYARTVTAECNPGAGGEDE